MAKTSLKTTIRVSTKAVLGLSMLNKRL